MTATPTPEDEAVAYDKQLAAHDASRGTPDKDKENQHRRSVETLELSGHDNTPILPEVYDFCTDNDIVLSREQGVALSALITSEIRKAVLRVEKIEQCRHCAAHGACSLTPVVELSDPASAGREVI